MGWIILIFIVILGLVAIDTYMGSPLGVKYIVACAIALAVLFVVLRWNNRRQEIASLPESSIFYRRDHQVKRNQYGMPAGQGKEAEPQVFVSD